MSLKNILKDLWISAAGLAAFLIIELPLMYFLIGMLGSNSYVFAIPAILGFLIMFCIEQNFVTSEKITTKKFFVYVYVIPEIFMIILSVISLSAAKSQDGFASSLGVLMQFASLSVGITIVLRILAQGTKVMLAKFESEEN